MRKCLPLAWVAVLVLVHGSAGAADERVVTRVSAQTSLPFLVDVQQAMVNYLRDSPVVLLVPPTDNAAQMEVLLDGAAAAGSRSQEGAVVLIATVRCQNGPSLYVLHRVGMCGGLGAAGCGTEFGKSVQDGALMIQRNRARLGFCLTPFAR